eukprot:3248932-Pleurochrysis_carterae.AAC.2
MTILKALAVLSIICRAGLVPGHPGSSVHRFGLSCTRRIQASSSHAHTESEMRQPCVRRAAHVRCFARWAAAAAAARSIVLSFSKTPSLSYVAAVGGHLLSLEKKAER